MDILKTYIKMSDHPLIQEHWKPRKGDYVLQRDGLFRPIGESYIYSGGGFGLLPVQVNYCWLPRQDEIQEMIGLEYTTPDAGSLQELTDFALDYNYNLDSMEQLWLAFYMHEKHELIWDGAKWIGED